MFFPCGFHYPYGPDLSLYIPCYDIEQRTLLEFPSLASLVVLPLTWPRIDYLVADVRMSDTVIVFFSFSILVPLHHILGSFLSFCLKSYIICV